MTRNGIRVVLVGRSCSTQTTSMLGTAVYPHDEACIQGRGSRCLPIRLYEWRGGGDRAAAVRSLTGSRVPPRLRQKRTAWRGTKRRNMMPDTERENRFIEAFIRPDAAGTRRCLPTRSGGKRSWIDST